CARDQSPHGLDSR
nr:immunoglobulin heavy chain junction region [Macaca mulatta]